MLHQLLQVNQQPGLKVKDRYGWAPLHILAQNKKNAQEKCDMITMLLEARAEVDVRGNRGATPLFKAAGTGASAQAALLLQAGADVNLTNDEGTTAYDASWANAETRAVVQAKGGRKGAGTTGEGRQIVGRKGHSISRERL